MSANITKITARQILDSRGNPTLEVTVYAGKNFATASVPSGASTGVHEAIELRDKTGPYNGKGISKAIKNVERVIAPLLRGVSVFEQAEVDRRMIAKDGTTNKKRLGANSILGVSIAVSRLGSLLSNKPLYSYLARGYGFPSPKELPIPLLNVINGGLHADSGTDIQEFFFIPKKGKFAEKIATGHKAIQSLKEVLLKKKLATGLGDEGGFAPKLNSNEKAFRLMLLAIAKAKLKLGKDISLGIDAASSEFYNPDKEIYTLIADRKNFKPASIWRLYQKWIQKYSLEIIEDGCSEDDFMGWQKLTQNLSDQVILVGDDLFVTNPYRLQAGIITGIANSILIKPNQIGSVSETMETVSLAKKYGYKVVVSHRSGETTDDFIADLAVAVEADYIKAGSLARGERLAKYNRLLAIAAELKK